jgi:hypothetical protein
VAYEWLCGDPVARFEELYRLLGLDWSARTGQRVRATSSEGDNLVYSLNRPTGFQVDRWKERVSPEDSEACRRFVEPFGLPYYPEFEPYVETFSGAAAVTPHG